MGLLADKLAGHNFAMPKIESPVFLALLEGAKRGISETRAHEIVKQAYARHSGLNLNDDGEVPGAVPKGQWKSANPPSATGIRSGRPPLNLTDEGTLDVRNILAKSVFDRYRTSNGSAWGDVGAHELDGMERDGTIARAIKDQLGVLSNSQHYMKIRELLRPDTFEQIMRNRTNGS